ncbi:MAG: polysaccharide biosynthesis protein [Flavobacteriales bacterium]|nr:polysaccharide biosynthesis protein [Flavobacteriales bacterium]MCW8914044.1 polysaccharide biosynthesis protein [Flavobacteriales bacterium]MCW8938102.1 polysaccharide biosynthesis protein [Flavobacteriales bacterium]MCW8941120.1 polysaccharide biosynthesis protein [Flavobacteriales bacterium]MCW8968047.1 polysaccharide biosynthesis protein [Flavobacteriales bacterium]
MNLIHLLFKNNIPRWIIFLIDLSICFISVVIAYLVRFNFDIPDIAIVDFPLVFGVVLGIRAISFLVSKTYKGIIKHTSSKDSQRIFVTLTIGSLAFVVVNLIFYYGINKTFPIPFSIIIIDYMATLFLMITLRVLFKSIYTEIMNPYREKSNVIIFGAGESGIITKRTLDKDAGLKYKVLAFIDEDPKKEGKILEGVKILRLNKLDDLLSKEDVAHVIISIQNLSAAKKKKLIDTCLKYDTKVLNVPPVSNWINGQLSFKQIKKIQIEELLEREPIKLSEDKIKQQLSDKVILVTGAAGSIGSEMVRQIVHFSPKKIILLDQAESPLYDMELELGDDPNHVPYEIVIGDIRNKERMENLFKTFQPNYVFHAAAYKHVPMMENNPSESIFTNVLGTKVIADLAVRYNIERFVMVSTDKAVNPTNVMGASKRIAEIYIQSLSTTANTKFITTRFGNVLGSNGSVIPRFRKQIESGGPITITHPDITRFFMTIPEACQLVLEAGTSGEGGEIYIFDMGESVKILDLAKKMIKLSGLTLDKDIKITYTGLRPGEKLYEELLANEENTIATHHNQIMIAKVKKYDFQEVDTKINQLISSFNAQNNFQIVAQMKALVPEFKSKNSVYEELDK